MYLITFFNTYFFYLSEEEDVADSARPMLMPVPVTRSNALQKDNMGTHALKRDGPDSNKSRSSSSSSRSANMADMCSFHSTVEGKSFV